MIWKSEIHVLQIVRLVLLVELFAQAYQQIVVLDRIGDGGKLLGDLSLLEEVGDLGPIVLVLGAERV